MLVVMEEAARQQLKALIEACGKDFYQFPDRCEGGLQDFLAKYKREKNLLITALREDVPKILIESPAKGLPLELVQGQLVQKLQADHDISEEGAKWVVESWAEALGVRIDGVRINQDQGGEIEKKEIKKQPRKKRWFIVGGVTTVAIALIVGGFSLNHYLNWLKLKTILQEARTFQTDAKYKECIDRAGAVAGDADLYKQAQIIENNCRLNLAKQLAKIGQLSAAISEAKSFNLFDTILGEMDKSDYDEAQKLIANWSSGREIQIGNECPHPFKIWLHYTDPNDNSRGITYGYWAFIPNESVKFLSSKGSRLKVLDPIYYYAQATDNSGIEWKGDGDHIFTYDNRQFNMKRMNTELDENGNFSRVLICPPSTP
jgi:hypothetical protein